MSFVSRCGGGLVICLLYRNTAHELAHCPRNSVQCQPCTMNVIVGDCIGPYEIKSLLGEGGMGVVFHARDTVLQRDVALKVLPEQFANDAERFARFQREAQVLASLN